MEGDSLEEGLASILLDEFVRLATGNIGDVVGDGTVAASVGRVHGDRVGGGGEREDEGGEGAEHVARTVGDERETGRQRTRGARGEVEGAKQAQSEAYKNAQRERWGACLRLHITATCNPRSMPFILPSPPSSHASSATPFVRARPRQRAHNSHASRAFVSICLSSSSGWKDNVGMSL